MSLKLTENALKLLKERYLKKNETPEGMFKRVANCIGDAEEKFYPESQGGLKDNISYFSNKFYKIMTELKFLPNSPTLMNAGTDSGQLFACFVLPIEDNMDSIFTTLKNAALIHKSGGGTGFSFSNIRAKGSKVNSTQGIASGPVSFLKVYNAATEAVKQGGRRRGANMGMLSVDHPDIMEFIACKEKEGDITNFNLSIAITDEFMNSLKSDSKNLKIFNKIIDLAWKNGEPGIVFIDTINKRNPTPDLGRIEATNPCGEQPLLPYEACVLGSINLAKFVDNNNMQKHVPTILYLELKETIKLAVRFLDNAIEVNKYPLEEIKKVVQGNRKIGLGVMGFADMLIQLRIPYDSNEGVEIAKEVMSFINNVATEESIRLAEERGHFKNQSNNKDEWRRNATLTTIAPTGSISIIANCSGGIEPNYALSFKKNVIDSELIEFNPYLEKVLCELYNATITSLVVNRAKSIVFNDGTLQNLYFSGEINEIKKIRNIFKTSSEIPFQRHIEMQAAFQQFTDNAISKTINMPNSATKEDIKQAYLRAYKAGCKGLTVYRDGSRQFQVLETGNKVKEGIKEIRDCESQRGDTNQNNGWNPSIESKILKDLFELPNKKSKPNQHETYIESDSIVQLNYINKIKTKRPDIVEGRTVKIKTSCGSMFVTVNEINNLPIEVFARIGKVGGCGTSQLDAIARTISLALRHGIDVKDIIKQLINIRCNSVIGLGPDKVLSCADAIAQTLNNKYCKEDINKSEIKSKNGCPECGGELTFTEGCEKCTHCNWSKCE